MISEQEVSVPIEAPVEDTERTSIVFNTNVRGK